MHTWPRNFDVKYGDPSVVADLFRMVTPYYVSPYYKLFQIFDKKRPEEITVGMVPGSEFGDQLSLKEVKEKFKLYGLRSFRNLAELLTPPSVDNRLGFSPREGAYVALLEAFTDKLYVVYPEGGYRVFTAITIGNQPIPGRSFSVYGLKVG